MIKLNNAVRIVLFAGLALTVIHTVLTFDRVTLKEPDFLISDPSFEPSPNVTETTPFELDTTESSTTETYYGHLHAIPERFYAPNNNYSGAFHHNIRKANATLVMLARNSDVDGAVESIKELELKFNQKWRYPWVFLNDAPFDDEFKRRVSALIRSPIDFAVIPKEHWVQPDWINEGRASKARDDMARAGVPYGNSISYRNMCRFNSGFFFQHPVLQKYRWYWRVEPDVHFSCDIDFDPFLFLQETNKTYGFNIAMYEYDKTIPSLWNNVKEFMDKYPQHIAPGNGMNFLSQNHGQDYNLCHFWSNFEIGDLDFWRGQAYTDFFQHLDATGGFYYERWGDAPIHTIAVALLLPAEKVHFFNEIGYQHTTGTHCPQGDKAWTRGKCMCGPGPGLSFDYHHFSCLKYWDAIAGSLQDDERAQEEKVLQAVEGQE